jgi:hypothetical protein
MGLKEFWRIVFINNSQQKLIMKYYIYFFCILGLTKLSAQTAGPSSAEMDAGWFSVGLGIASPYELSFSSSANFGRNNIFQIALHTSDNLKLSGGLPVDGSGAISLSYGLSSVNDLGRIAFFIGPAYSWGQYYHSEVNSKYKTIAVVSNLQLVISPFKELGLGFEMFANLNPKEITAGISLIFVIEGNK